MVENLPWWDYPRGPGGVRRFLEVGLAKGMTVERCLAGTSLTAVGLNEPDFTVEASAELRVARNLVAALDNAPGLGAEVGAGFTISSAGIFGFAVISSPTLRDALAVGMRYLTLGSFFLHLVVTESDDEVRLAFDDTEVPADVRDFLTERDLTAAAQVFPFVLGGSTDSMRLELPQAASGVAAFLPGIEVQRADMAAVVLPSALLDLPLPAADPNTAALFERQCAELLDRRQVRRGTSGAVRAMLLRKPATMPSMDDVAYELHIDGRTLRRRLVAEGTAFRALEAEVREALAIELLTQAGLNVGDVARRLGYSEVAAFSRAFKRWTGRPPQEYRRQ